MTLWASERFRYGGQSAHRDPGCRALRGAHVRVLDPHEATRFKPCRLCMKET